MKFLTLDTILMLHSRLIAETGGQPGLRDRGLLESAMKAAENRHYYEQATVPVCAAPMPIISVMLMRFLMEISGLLRLFRKSF
ncbi:MAG: hypothetical protein AAGC93_31020 [Cyanobacteria bacterium P01_F01_bin.53]